METGNFCDFAEFRSLGCEVSYHLRNLELRAFPKTLAIGIAK